MRCLAAATKIWGQNRKGDICIRHEPFVFTTAEKEVGASWRSACKRTSVGMGHLEPDSTLEGGVLAIVEGEVPLAAVSKLAASWTGWEEFEESDVGGSEGTLCGGSPRLFEATSDSCLCSGCASCNESRARPKSCLAAHAIPRLGQAVGNFGLSSCRRTRAKGWRFPDNSSTRLALTTTTMTSSPGLLKALRSSVALGCCCC